ncbi:MAG: hypothetical protein HOP96_02755 [Sphingomonas sp.]|nr:hypothetical protein [Sphingomonas sp.]
MSQAYADYYRNREQAEREAAQNATCPQARRAHKQMANAYARLVHDGAGESAGA